jgi:hypothetical protein
MHCSGADWLKFEGCAKVAERHDQAHSHEAIWRWVAGMASEVRAYLHRALLAKMDSVFSGYSGPAFAGSISSSSPFKG